MGAGLSDEDVTESLLRSVVALEQSWEVVRFCSERSGHSEALRPDQRIPSWGTLSGVEREMLASVFTQEFFKIIPSLHVLLKKVRLHWLECEHCQCALTLEMLS